MGFQWYAIDERGFVAEVVSSDAALPLGESFDLFETVVLEYALHRRPELQRRLYRYREATHDGDRMHVRYQLPDEPLPREELVAVCELAQSAVRAVQVDFDCSDAFIPEEITDELPVPSRDSVIVEKEPVDQTGTG
jgi:hypothetical protein